MSSHGKTMTLSILLMCLLIGCQSRVQDLPSAVHASIYEKVKLGAQVLAETEFSLLDGKRVGLIVNHTARVDTVHLMDLVSRAPNVTLAALFGPEHGLRGTEDAGVRLGQGIDEKTGVPVYSLYGSTLKPTPDMLVGIDVLVFDIQDIGARFYTYISTMGLSMQAAAEQHIPFVVLDRPNPLGGTGVSGFIREPEFESFVGQYPIPIMHGLTIGELALMIKGERMLPGLESLDLTVVEMENWRRDMLWPETGLNWITTSPNIPDFETALVYPGMCLFEAVNASEGRGTYQPFKKVGAVNVDGAALSERLNGVGLPGVLFDEISFTPQRIEGMSSNPKLLGTALRGVRLTLTDPTVFNPMETGIHVLYAFYQEIPDSEKNTFFNQRRLSRLAGTTRLYEMMTVDAVPGDIISSWQDEIDTFYELRRPYLRYE